jgi:WD40 repeat protein
MKAPSLGFVLLALALVPAFAGVAQAADPDDQLGGLSPTQVLVHGGPFRPAALGGGDLILLSLAFSPDGKTIASAGGGHLGGDDGPAQGEVKLWEVATGKLLQTIAVESQIVFCVGFSPDGKLLAAASGPGTPVQTVPGEIRLWSPPTGQLVRKMQGHSCGAYVVAFSPDGQLLASGGIATIDKSKVGAVRGQHATGDINLWDLKTGKALWTGGGHSGDGHSGTVAALVFSANGKTLASSGGLFDGQVKLWDVAAGTDQVVLASKAENVAPVAFGPEAATLVVLSNNITGLEEGPSFTVQVCQWDTISKKQIRASTIKNGNVYRMALSHQGDLIACGCADGVHVYDVASQVEVRSLPSKFRMRRVAFSPDGELLAAASDDGTVKLWSVRTLRK